MDLSTSSFRVLSISESNRSDGSGRGRGGGGGGGRYLHRQLFLRTVLSAATVRLVRLLFIAAAASDLPSIYSGRCFVIRIARSLSPFHVSPFIKKKNKKFFLKNPSKDRRRADADP